TFAVVLAQDLEDATVAREVLVAGLEPLHPAALCRLEHLAEPVREQLVGREEAEAVGVLAEDLAEPSAELPGGLVALDTGRGELECEGPGGRELEGLEQLAAIRVRRGADPLAVFGTEPGEARDRAALSVEELLRAVAAQPVLEQAEVRRVLPHVGERHLVGPERPLDLLAVDFSRAGPPFRGAQDDQRPARPAHPAPFPRATADLADAVVAGEERLGERVVDAGGIASGHHVDLVSVTLEEAAQ